jgi:hypothetical protein
MIFVNFCLKEPVLFDMSLEETLGPTVGQGFFLGVVQPAATGKIRPQ